MIACANPETCGCVLKVGRGTEAPASGLFGGWGNHCDGSVQISRTTQLAPVACKITLEAAAAVAAQQLEAPGEFLQGGTAFGLPAPLIGDRPFAEGVLVFRAVQEAVDISLIPLAVQAIGVLTHFRVVSRCATEKMAEGQLDVAVSRAVIKEAAAVQVAFGNAAHQLTDADFTELELRLFDDLPLAVHHVSVAKHLLVHSTDDLFFPGVLIAWDQLERGFTLLREAFDP